MFYTNLLNFEKLIDSALDQQMLSSTFPSGPSHYSEKVDDVYVLELPVPGLSKEDLNVRIINGKLEVKGGKEGHRWSPKFEKTFSLPKGIDTGNVKASAENGILEVKIGISKESETIVKII
jgi:HSP20 family protein